MWSKRWPGSDHSGSVSTPMSASQAPRGPAASRLCQSTGRVSASQCTEPNSSPKGWRTLRPAGQRGAAGRHSLASTESRGGGGPLRTLRFGCKSEKSTFYIRMSINRGTFTVTLRNLHQQDLSPDWVLLILILNTVTIHSSSWFRVIF